MDWKIDRKCDGKDGKWGLSVLVIFKEAGSTVYLHGNMGQDYHERVKSQLVLLMDIYNT